MSSGLACPTRSRFEQRQLEYRPRWAEGHVTRGRSLIATRAKLAAQTERCAKKGPFIADCPPIPAGIVQKRSAIKVAGTAEAAGKIAAAPRNIREMTSAGIANSK
ncbi:MAG: hypothetical protein E5V93_12735 [Mesorhizobium sp.]|nr:MAG: hypothetical protein E5V93_12735 [Mesorhizobium sp.]